jgi:hypothetical protein
LAPLERDLKILENSQKMGLGEPEVAAEARGITINKNPSFRNSMRVKNDNVFTICFLVPGIFVEIFDGVFVPRDIFHANRLASISISIWRPGVIIYVFW